MIELLEFIFRSGWTFAGTCFLLLFALPLILILLIGLIESMFNGIVKIIKESKNSIKNDNTNQNRPDNI